MKVLVCGSRGWSDEKSIVKRIQQLPVGSTVIHGGAHGADRIAGNAAAAIGFHVAVYNPDWDRYGSRAGIIRNNEMLDQEPDLVIAFWDGKSNGTFHTIFEAHDRGIKVEVISA